MLSPITSYGSQLYNALDRTGFVIVTGLMGFSGAAYLSGILGEKENSRDLEKIKIKKSHPEDNLNIIWGNCNFTEREMADIRHCASQKIDAYITGFFPQHKFEIKQSDEKIYLVDLQRKVKIYENVHELKVYAVPVLKIEKDRMIGSVVEESIKVVKQSLSKQKDLYLKFELQHLLSIHQLSNNKRILGIEAIDKDGLQKFYDHTLKTYFKSYPQTPLRLKLKILSQITRGLDFLHSHSIAHGDFKPRNILIAKTNSDLRVDIIDFEDTYFPRNHIKLASDTIKNFQYSSNALEKIFYNRITLDYTTYHEHLIIKEKIENWYDRLKLDNKLRICDDSDDSDDEKITEEYFVNPTVLNESIKYIVYEILKDRKQIDLFALGRIFYHVLTGNFTDQLPCCEIEEDKPLIIPDPKSYLKELRKSLVEIDCSSELKEVTLALLDPNPAKRPSTSQVLKISDFLSLSH